MKPVTNTIESVLGKAGHLPKNMSLTEPVTEEPKPVPKKRGRKPKPVNPEEWLNRTEMVFGVIKAPEKEFVLKLHVEEGLTAEEIAEKLHRLPKGIKRAITSAANSGKLDMLKTEFRKSNEPADDTPEEDDLEKEDLKTGTSSYYKRGSSYIMPANTEVIDGVKYDIGGIMALHNAGWPSNKIAREKGYDEDMVRVVLEKHNS